MIDVQVLIDRLDRFARGGPVDTEELIVDLRTALEELRDIRSAVGAQAGEPAVDVFYRGLTDVRLYMDDVAAEPHGEAIAAKVCALLPGETPELEVELEVAGPCAPDVLLDLLRLTGDDDAYGVTEDEIAETWSEGEIAETERWAVNSHLNASDHDDVEVPTVPLRIRVRHAEFVGRQFEGA